MTLVKITYPPLRPVGQRHIHRRSRLYAAGPAVTEIDRIEGQISGSTAWVPPFSFSRRFNAPNHQDPYKRWVIFFPNPLTDSTQYTLTVRGYIDGQVVSTVTREFEVRFFTSIGIDYPAEDDTIPSQAFMPMGSLVDHSVRSITLNGIDADFIGENVEAGFWYAVFNSLEEAEDCTLTAVDSAWHTDSVGGLNVEDPSFALMRERDEEQQHTDAKRHAKVDHKRMTAPMPS